MKTQFKTSRRSVLAGMTAVAGSLTLGRSAWGMLDGASTRNPGNLVWSLNPGYGDAGLAPFSRSQVHLRDGVCKQQAEINQSYLDSLKTDRLLHKLSPYRRADLERHSLRRVGEAGLRIARPLQRRPLPLRGSAGLHGAGNETLRKSGDTMVAELARCQKANGGGYLSAFPRTEFETLKSLGKVWAPFYTLHKIMARMVDMYIHTGNEQALACAEGMATWVVAYFQGVPDEQRQRMLRTEYGGMNEVLANLYGLTGKQQYLDTAHMFEQPSFLDPLAGHRDELKGLHANTHVPKIIGAARMYELTGERRYREIALYFLDEVLTQRSYVIGNTSVGELWRSDPGNLKGSLSSITTPSAAWPTT